MLHALKDQARQAKLALEGANLQLDWIELKRPRRRLLARLLVASPASQGEVRHLGFALEAHRQVQASSAGLELSLVCQRVHTYEGLVQLYVW